MYITIVDLWNKLGLSNNNMCKLLIETQIWQRTKSHRLETSLIPTFLGLRPHFPAAWQYPNVGEGRRLSVFLRKSTLFYQGLSLWAMHHKGLHSNGDEGVSKHELAVLCEFMCLCFRRR